MVVIRARTAVAVVFALNGLAFATWVSRIPESRTALGLSASELGLLLLALSAGAVTALPTAGAVTGRLGPARTVAGAAVVGASGLALTGLGAGAATSVALTAAGLFLLGFGSASWDVAMNVEGTAVERRLGRTIMPRFHAGFSLGTVAGAGVGAAAAWSGLPVAAHLGGLAVLVLAGALGSVTRFLPAPPRQPGAERVRHGRVALAAWREPRTLLIGVLTLAMAFAEGTANDWLAVALVDGYGVSPAVGALGFALFVAAMTAGRTWGTVALDRWGRVAVLYVTGVTAAAGAVVVALSASVVVAAVGIVLWGLGTSLGFPVGMSAAADDERHAAPRVAVASTIGYTAFLAGPPLLGLLAEAVGVQRALIVVAVLMLPAMAVVPAARPPR